jgi:anaerobic selenocysteine-containing dehydrogenase
VVVERGRVVSIDGSTAAPSTDGYICGKVRSFDRRVYHAERILHPAVRSGPKGSGQFSRVTWDEALDLIAVRMSEARDRYGAESVLPYHYGGSNGVLTNEFSDARFFRRFGASRLARTLCAAPTGAAAQAMYGKMPGVAYDDYAHAKLIIVWGCNPSATGIHLVSHIKQGQKNGAKLVVIDPRRTPLARIADMHVSPKPGTDLPIALALVREMFARGWADAKFLAEHTRGSDDLRRAAEPWSIERAAAEAGIDARQLATLAEWYGTTSPAVIRCGWGQERNRNGGNSSMAILALPAVGGKFGVRGGGYAMSNTNAWRLQRTWIRAEEPATRLVNMNQLGRALTEYRDPAVELLFVYNSNAAVTAPNQARVLRGLEREDLFTVVFDQVMTDTARYADVILPATTFLEHYDLPRAYGPIGLRLGKPAIEPVGESRPNADVFGDLLARLDLLDEADPKGELEEVLDVLGRVPDPAGAELRDYGAATPPHDGRPIQFVDVFPWTADGKVDLFPVDLDAEAPLGLYGYQPDPATPAYPLALISPASDRGITSTLAELPRPEVRLIIHPDDAGPRDITDGADVRVFNALGEVRCRAQVGAWTRPGTIVLPKGLWRKHTANGYTANALAPDSLTDLGGGACFNDARVQVEIVRMVH